MKQVDKNKFSFSDQVLGEELIFLLTALNISKAGLTITDCSQPDDPIVYCNKAFENLTGYSREEIIGHNCRFLQGNDDNRQEREVIKNTLHAGEECTIEIRNYKKNGSLFWNELHLKPIKDDLGKLLYYVGVQNDITRQKLADQQLRIERLKVEKQVLGHTYNFIENNNLLNTFLETVNESILILSRDLKILKVNTSFLKTFHIAEDEVLNQYLFEIDHCRWDLMNLRSLLDQHHVNDSILEDVVTRVGKKMLKVKISQIFLEKELNIILAIEDITELKEIDRRKDDFLNVASHELKTPLTTIMACIQLTQRMIPKEADDKLKDTLTKAKEHIDKLEHLISDLLDVSKIKTGKIELSKGAFNLDAMVFHVADQLRKAHSNYTINISGYASNYYVGDKQRLEQVVLHLLKNSIKYTPSGGNINIHLSRLSDFIKVSITDYGLGVDYQHQKKIFENFFRVDEVQKQYPGIGIGLYISDQIVKNHGGTLWVESAAGEGATFSFTLPLKFKNDDKENTDL
ncbi:PAS domain-containing sensor histidine kinase [Olivibacter domesticus]|uniref:histidine kinase n=1 Tax=Olivibacter domesticus TaxID=407022 RepID=A0A1H7XKH7_OLID1|nr:PAS domain-containing sensor histidine kinase [Olivibacter domesticus]SEM33698.1 PAS domain S-box-containing protein [Olivibacter domesticus]